jgi:hypothetical protein
VTLDFINKYPVIKSWLIRQVGYYSKELYLFDDNQLKKNSRHNAKIIILAKCHYSESWQSFASVNKKEVDKILSLKKETLTHLGISFQTFTNKAIDGFDVKVTTIDENVITTLGQDKIYIPETELFTSGDSYQLLEIETLAGKVFCSFSGNKTKISYAKGIVDNTETYKLSVGLSSDVKAVVVNNDKFPSFLLSQLFKLRLNNFFSSISFDIKSWFNLTHLHLLYWGPLVSALCFYLLLNGYLYFKTNSFEQSLTLDGDKVGEIITQKRKLDQNISLFSVLSSEFGEQNFVHNHWQIVDTLLSAEMKITRINFQNSKLVIRGVADKASDVLTTITEHERIISAAFQGPVRKSRGKDSFILTLQVKGS